MTLPAWVERYRRDIADAARLYDVSPDWIAAIIQQESGGDPNARSPAGANGLMQVVGGPFDPRASIMAGTAFFRAMLDRYHGSIDLALAAYNAGPGNVDKYGGIPPFEETQRYVPAVKRWYTDLFKGMLGDSGGNPIDAPSPIPPKTTQPDTPSVGGGTVSGVTTGGPTSSGFPFALPKITLPNIDWKSGLELPQGFASLALAITQLPTQLAAPFVAALNQAGATMAFVGQAHIWERLGLLVLGAILLVIGVVLFALSFVDASAVRAIAAV